MVARAATLSTLTTYVLHLVSCVLGASRTSRDKQSYQDCALTIPPCSGRPETRGVDRRNMSQGRSYAPRVHPPGRAIPTPNPQIPQPPPPTQPRLFSEFAESQWAKARIEVQDYDPSHILSGPRAHVGDPGWDPRYMKWYTHGYYLLDVPLAPVRRTKRLLYFSIYKVHPLSTVCDQSHRTVRRLTRTYAHFTHIHPYSYAHAHAEREHVHPHRASVLRQRHAERHDRGGRGALAGPPQRPPRGVHHRGPGTGCQGVLRWCRGVQGVGPPGRATSAHVQFPRPPPLQVRTMG